MTDKEIIEKFNNSELGKDIRLQQFICSEEKIDLIREKYGENLIEIIKKMQESGLWGLFKLHVPKEIVDEIRDLNDFKFDSLEEIKKVIEDMLFNKEYLENDETIELLKILEIDNLNISGHLDSLEYILPLAEKLKTLKMRIFFE